MVVGGAHTCACTCTCTCSAGVYSAALTNLMSAAGAPISSASPTATRFTARTSCIENTSTPSPVVRLGIITIVSADSLEQCRFFFRYYTHVEHVAASDIYVVEAGASALLRTCYQSLVPPSNVVPMWHGRIRAWTRLIRDRELIWRRVNNVSDGFSMSYWTQYAKLLQRELLLERNYTHTLIAELDEVVTPIPSRYPLGLLDYLSRNQHRRTVAPAAFEVQGAWSFEPPLNWDSTPLLRQRSALLPACGLRKPVVSRVPTRFTFAMHNMADPTFFACDPSRFGSSLDCLDPDLWLIHLKCADLAPALADATFRLARPDLGENATAVVKALRHRCSNFETWRSHGCELGPTKGAKDSPNGSLCQNPVRLTFGITSPHRKEVFARIPQWLQDRV